MTSSVMKKKIKYQQSLLLQITLEKKVNIYLLKKCFKKLGRSTNQKVNFACRYSVTKMSLFTNMKDKLNILSKWNVAYQFSCPSCESSYIGKTEQTLFERTKEQVTRADSVIKEHFDNCVIGLFFWLFCISFYINWYHFLQRFGTSFNITRKKDFCHKFSFF